MSLGLINSGTECDRLVVGIELISDLKIHDYLSGPRAFAAPSPVAEICAERNCARIVGYFLMLIFFGLLSSAFGSLMARTPSLN